MIPIVKSSPAMKKLRNFRKENIGSRGCIHENRLKECAREGEIVLNALVCLIGGILLRERDEIRIDGLVIIGVVFSLFFQLWLLFFMQDLALIGMLPVFD